jgi:transcriptional regulator with XRE-family HTH domain
MEQIVAWNIRFIRNLRGWSAEAVAKRIVTHGGTADRQTITKIENGRRRVTIDDLRLLAKALEVENPWELTSPMNHHRRSIAASMVTRSGMPSASTR